MFSTNVRPLAIDCTESSYHAYWDCLVTEPISLFSLESESLIFDRSNTLDFSSSKNKRPNKFGMVGYAGFFSYNLAF